MSGVDLVVLVATSRTFETTDVWILSTNIAAALSALISVPDSAAPKLDCATGFFAFFEAGSEVFFVASLVAGLAAALALLPLLLTDTAGFFAGAGFAIFFLVGLATVFTDPASASLAWARVAFDPEVNPPVPDFDFAAASSLCAEEEDVDAVPDALRARTFFLFDFVTVFAAVAFMLFFLNEPSNALISPGAACNFFILASFQTPSS